MSGPPLKPPGKPPGDPQGKRLSRQRALLLSEATRAARSLEVLLKRANYDFSECTKLITRMAEQEKHEVQRGIGRIESRKRFKVGSGHPLLENRPRSLLFIDESGKSKPEPPSPLTPPYFALGAVAMAAEKVDDYCAAANEISRSSLVGLI